MSYDGRDWMRTPPGQGGAFARHRMTWWIIGLNVGLWFLYASAISWGGPDAALARIFDQYLVLHSDEVLAKGRVWQLFTAFWLHDPTSLGHVFFNMLFLFFFGRITEEILGPRGYLSLYLRAGFASTIALTLVGLVTSHPYVALGASGCVFGVGVFLALRMPQLQVIFIIVRMPLWVLVGVFMVGSELVNLLVLKRGIGTAIGHLSGAVYGWAHHRFPALHTAGGPGLVARLRRRHADARARRQAADEVETRERVDELLDKIRRDGITSLTPAEKDYLERASKRFSGGPGR